MFGLQTQILEEKILLRAEFLFLFFSKRVTYNIRKLTFQNFSNFQLLQVPILCKIPINLEKDEIRNFETLDFRIFKLTLNFMSR